MSQDEIESRKKKAERGWLADPPPPPPRWLDETPEDRRRRQEAAGRRYAHLNNKPRPWLADPTKRIGKGDSE